jgi:hypothetical protein
VYLGVFRTADLVKVGGWNEHFSTNQDFELSQRIADLGLLWFEDGLPVRYLPRKTIREVFLQYHRFGRWKAHYWKTLGARPQHRQTVLLASPVVLGVLGGVTVRLLFRRITTTGWLLSAFVAILGSIRLGPQRILSYAVNCAVGGGWWTGVTRGLVKDDVVTEP